MLYNNYKNTYKSKIFIYKKKDQIWYNICLLVKKIKLIRRQYLYHEKPKLNDNITK